VPNLIPSLRGWLERLKGPAFKPREIRIICALVLCIAPIAFGFVLVSAPEPGSATGFAGLGGDFPQFFVAGRILNDHSAARLYDLQFQERLLEQVRPATKGLSLPYLYPPFLAVVFRPLAVLPYPWAYGVWSAISFCLYLFGMVTLVRQFGPVDTSDREAAVLLALSFEPFLIETIIGGQVASIGFFALAFAIVQEQRGRPFSAGLMLSVCLYKPTLLVLILPMLVFSRRWRLILGFAAGGTVLMTASLLILGAGAWSGYVAATSQFGRLYFGAGGNVLRTWKYVDIRGFFSLLTGQYWLGLLGLCLAACAILPLLIRRWWRGGNPDTADSVLAWASVSVWTLLLNLYVPIYDSILVVIAFILAAHALGRASSANRRGVFRWLILLTFVTPWFSQLAARGTGLQVFTLVLVSVAVYLTTVPVDRARVRTRLAPASVERGT